MLLGPRKQAVTPLDPFLKSSPLSDSTVCPTELRSGIESFVCWKVDAGPSSRDHSRLIVLGLAIQVSAFTTSCDPISSTRSDAASELYAGCYNLLRIGSRELTFLDLCVPILSAIRSVLSIALQQKSLFDSNQRIKQVLDLLLVSVLEVLNEALACGRGFASGGRSEIDLFRWSIGVIQDRKDQLLDEIWAFQLPPDLLDFQDPVGHIGRMRDWLRPNDRTIRAISTNLWAARTMHVEFTCEWFARPLLDFIRSPDRAFWVEGPPGCGKSTLYNWIVESLQSQVGGQEYVVLDYSIDPLLPSELAVSCLLKGLLQKAFENFPGLTSLFSTLADTMETAATSDGRSEVTEALWIALGVFLQNVSQPSIIVIDGLSELDGGDNVARTCLERLYHSVLESAMVRLLLLSRSFNQPPDVELRRFAIQRSNLQEDIRRVIDRAKAVGHVKGQPEITDWIISKANGNFLWGLLVLQIWKFDSYQGVSAPWKSLPTSLEATTSLLVSKVDFEDPMIRLLLLFSLVAVRPLRVDEAQSLLSLDVPSKCFNRQEFDLSKAGDQGFLSIMIVDDGVVRFRHSAFKRSLRDMAVTKLKYSLQDIHFEMAMRLLLYLRLVIVTRSELTLKPIASSIVEDLLRSHPLVTYALRYWTCHYDSGHVSNLPYPDADSNLRPVFPESTFVATVEATYWKSQSLCETVRALQVARHARQSILGSHLATLQTTALLASNLERVRKLPEAAITFAASFQLAQQLLPEYHDFAVNCISECLECLRSLPDSASIDLPVIVPDMLLYMISKYSKQLGPGNDQALEYHHLLARYYADQDQHELSTRVHRDIYRLTVDRFGKSSLQAKAVAGDFATQLQKGDQTGDSSQYNDLVYDSVMDSFSITDSRRVNAAIMKAETCKRQNDILSAELEYLSLMHGITEHRHHQENDESRQTLARIGLRYAGLLSEQNRLKEAQSILLGLWACFEGRQEVTLAVKDVLKDIAKGLQHAGIPAVAVAVLSKILEGSKDANFDASELEIKETVAQITSALMDSSQGGSVMPRATEDALLQTFESVKLQGVAAMSPQFINVCRQLIDSFILEGRWKDIIYIASSALHSLWPAVLDGAGEEQSTSGFDPALGDLAIRLAQAYGMSDAHDAAGYVYRYILRSAKGSGLVASPFFASTAQAAFKGLEKTGQTKEMIDVLQELVGHYQTTLGETDPATVDGSYALASVCMEHGEVDLAKRQYEKIAASLQMDGYHDKRALPALQALLMILRSRKLWDLMERVYNDLWRTFLEKGKEYRIRENTAKTLFKEYSQLLKNHLRADLGLIHQVREEYRRGCVSAFGEQSLATLEATICLAKSWEQSQSDNSQAIQLYESIIDGQQGGMRSLECDILATLDQVETILRSYYRTHLDDDVDQRALDRAIMLQEKQYVKDRASYGLYSPRSLSSLATWVSFLTKEGSLQSRGFAVQVLEQTVKSILLSDCEGKALFDAAATLASSYLEGEYIIEGLSVAQTLREQMIFRETSGRRLDMSKESAPSQRSKLTFLTAFETRMRGSMEGFAEIHSRSLLEVVLRESFQALDPTTSPHEQVLTRGANLQALLKNHYPSYKGEAIQQQLFDLFMERYSPAFTTGTQANKRFFAVLSKALSTQRNGVEIPHLACIAVNEEAQRLADLQEFEELLMVSGPGFDFIRYLGAYGQDSDLKYGFQLGLILGDVGPRLCSDHVVSKQMLELSKQILREVLQLCRTKEFSLEKISIEELSRVAAVLGRQQNYYDLEVSPHVHLI